MSKFHSIQEETNWSTFDWYKYIKWINFLRAIKKDASWWKLEMYGSIEYSNEPDDSIDKNDTSFKYAGCKYHGNRLDPTCPECNDVGGMNKFDNYLGIGVGKTTTHIPTKKSSSVPKNYELKLRTVMPVR